MDDNLINVPDEMSFEFGFHIAQMLVKQQFRDWLKTQGHESGARIYVADKYRSVAELDKMVRRDAEKFLRLNPSVDRYQAHVAVQDEGATYGVRLFEVAIRRD